MLQPNKVAVVLQDFTTTFRSGNLDHLEDRLHPNVRWEGVEPHLICHDGDEVMEVFRAQMQEDFHLDQVEVIDAGEKAVLCIRSSGNGDAGIGPVSLIFQVFTFEGDRIVRMQDFRTRDDALRAAGLTDRATWR